MLVSNGIKTTTYTVNDAGEMLVDSSSSILDGRTYARSYYNEKGQLIKTQTDEGDASTAMKPTLYEYDSFGNRVKETISDLQTPTVSNALITQYVNTVEKDADNRIWQVNALIRNNASGTTFTETRKSLLSEDAVLEYKTIAIDARGKVSEDRTEYVAGALAKRLRKYFIPTSNWEGFAEEVDGFMLNATDHTGSSSSQIRAWTANGMTQTRTDARGNTTTITTDKAGRTLSVMDAAGNVTATEYGSVFDQPVKVTNAAGNTTCSRYDLRGRKVAEWGTATQPVLMAYDDADRMVSLTTFRVPESELNTDPQGRTDGDSTTWTYDEATGLTTRKTYADATQEDITYNAFNQKATLTDARGKVVTWSYDVATGLNTAITYSDNTPGVSFTYNHLNMPVTVTDVSGTRTIAYNAYNEAESETLVENGYTHLTTELRDAYGRSAGFTYARNGEVLHTVSTGYGPEGNIYTAGMTHGGEQKNFGFGYLFGTPLINRVTMPNGMELSKTYEEKRDLCLSMAYKRGTTTVAERTYTYDALARPVTRITAREELATVNDTFGYNNRSELVNATVNNGAYGYAYDNIGNRETASELTDTTAYATNALNQYTAITEGEEAPFAPTYDAAGNQTKIETATGIWNVTYNAENRPVQFTSEDGNMVIDCAYDYMGRRVSKKVTVNNTVTQHLRFLYRGYLQIGAYNALNGNFQWFILWGPTEPIATRPLAIRKDGTWYAYGIDLTKNVCEIFGTVGTIATRYDYTPFGEVTATGNVTQPIQWSSEFADTDLDLIYYNYRHYNPKAGRWINRDPIAEEGGLNLYGVVGNNAIIIIDFLGLKIKITRQRVNLDDSFKKKWYGKTGINKNVSVRDKYKPTQVGENKVTRTKHNKSIRRNGKIRNVSCYSVQIEKSIEYNVNVRSSVASNLVNKVYTQAGLDAIIAHEERRIEVYQKAYKEYLEIFENNIKNRCAKHNLNLQQANNYKERLTYWLKTYQNKSKLEFMSWVKTQQDNITKENLSIDYITEKIGDSELELINGIKKIYSIPEPKKLIMECPDKRKL